MLHAMMLEATNGKYFYAPIAENPSKILDLGTGTGIWAIESESTKRETNLYGG
jgi:methylase of polypeptide subunit release factors